MFYSIRCFWKSYFQVLSNLREQTMRVRPMRKSCAISAATAAICAEMGHQEEVCQCRTVVAGVVPPMPFVLVQNDRHPACQTDDLQSLPFPSIFVLGKKNNYKRIGLKSFEKTCVAKNKTEMGSPSKERLEKRRELKNNLFRHLGIVRTAVDVVDADGMKQEDSKPTKSKESIANTFCTLCCQNFSSSKMLLLHNTKQHGKASMECPVCGKTLKTTAAFNKHMKTHLGDVQYHITCELCDRKFKNKQSLYTHVKVSHGEDEYENLFSQKGATA
ncbi:unnamed protein product [Caenorhabditis auriculariae]|uniref:C2H2-type domain-containing protein n=1 Tax=Caenorhabditis auriculariae TaxID=2777116 RepID=A0A8S1H504_9PELO|nr:unnamed protein product [Caenorhabditis auriculariae]